MHARTTLGAALILAALTGHAQSLNDFVTSWQTTTANESITIPTTGGGYNYTVNWGDGTTLSGYTGDATHVYTTAGMHEVRVSGAFPRIYFNNTGDRTKIKHVVQWGTGSWTSMANAFKGCTALHLDATDAPDLSACTDLSGIFYNCIVMNAPVNNWDVHTITNMADAFSANLVFNQPLTNWDVSHVTDMSNMFYTCYAFNQDLSGWNVSQVTDMAQMFRANYALDKDFGGWDIGQVTDMTNMFTGCNSMSTANYDSTLIGWARLDPGETTIHNGVTLGANVLQYCAGAAAHLVLTDTYNWAITDAGPGGCAPTDEFVTTWQTTTANESITIPTTGSGYNYYVDWGDGSTTTHSDADASTDATHTYVTAGSHTVRIGGAFPRIYFNDTGDRTKILDVVQWGTNPWTSMEDAFQGCSNLQISATDAPDLSACTSLEGMLRSCTAFNSPINNWDVSTITLTRRMFENATQFNQPLDLWDMGQVGNSLAMFKNAIAFNQDIGGWDMGQDTIMGFMFQDADAFDQDISGWDVDQVTGFAGMFQNAIAFDQDLGNWDISGATSMSNMLLGSGLSTANYDATLIGWSTLEPGETTIPTGISLEANGLHYCAGLYARIALVATYGWTITDAGPDCPPEDEFVTTWQNGGLNQPITIPTTGSGYNYYVDWGDGTVTTHSDADASTNATHTYASGGSHTVRIGGAFPRIFFNGTTNPSKLSTVVQWGNIAWTSFANAFRGCNLMDVTATDTPDLSGVTDVSGMFYGCDLMGLNANANWNWDLSGVTNMNSMFRNATAFDRDLGSWDVSNVTDMGSMFQGAGLSTANYDALLIGWSALPLQPNVVFNAGSSTYCLGVTARASMIAAPNNWTITDAGFSSCAPADEFVTTWQTTTANETITIPTTGPGYQYYVDWGDGTVTNHSDADASTDATHIYATAGLHTVRIGGGFPRIYFNNGGDKDKILDVVQWGSIQWTSMFGAFRGCNNLQMSATDAPDLSQCTSLQSMFRGCISLNSPVSSWDVSHVTDMSYLFRGCTLFDQPVNTWVVAQVTNMEHLFAVCPAFDQDLSTWNTGAVLKMNSMFDSDVSFNQDIRGWDVGQVYTMNGMLQGATAFDQDLGAWDISSLTAATGMLANSGLSTVHYDSTLIGWARLDPGESQIPSGLNLGADGLLFCAGAGARLQLINTHGWAFSGDALGGCGASDEFVTTWQTNYIGETITIPTTGTGYNYYVDWGDGTVSNYTADATHAYTSPGLHTVRIGGAFPHIYFNSVGDKDKILDVVQWGSIQWTSMVSAFRGCTNLQVSATDAPDLSQCTSMQSMFRGCSSFNTPVASWDVSHVTDMSYLFRDCTIFNQPVDTWDVAQVTNMEHLFAVCPAFDQDLSSWNTGAVQKMNSMFEFDVSFQQDISGWDVSQVFSMNGMLQGATAFDRDLGAWDISSLTAASNMLSNTSLSTANYDSTLIGWARLDAGETQIPAGLTLGADGLTYCLGTAAHHELTDDQGWTITDAGAACSAATAFITTWQTTAANETITIPTTGSGYYYLVDWGDGAYTFRSDADGNTNATHAYATAGIHTVSIYGDFPRIYFFNAPDAPKVRTVEQWGARAWDSFSSAFRGCANLDVTATDVPDLSGVQNMSSMFNGCLALGQAPGANWNWDVSGATNMNAMFYNDIHFNADISGWDVGNVTDFGAMFRNANTFDQNIGVWDVSSATVMDGMFRDADAFDRNLGHWDISNVTGMVNMLNAAGLSNLSYDSTLIGWATLSAGETQIPSGLTLDANGLIYCLATDARAELISTNGWTINGDARDPFCVAPALAFITTWETTTPNETITIPTTSAATAYDYVVDWGDGVFSAHQTGDATTNATHTYATPGIHTVKIDGAFPRIYMNGAPDTLKLLTVEQWGHIAWTSFAGAFRGCANLDVVATDAPHLSAVTNLSTMFYGCSSLGQDPGTNWNWDVSSVNNMNSTYYGCSLFNADITGWNVGNVTNFGALFRNAPVFDQDIGDWDMGSATVLNGMFRNAVAFDQDLGGWNVSNVGSMDLMFDGTALSTANYDNLLIGWSALTLQPNVVFNAGSSTYCTGAAGRAVLTAAPNNWTITDAGFTGCTPADEFVTTWQTTTANETITIPATGTGYFYYVDWGDGTVSIHGDALANTNATHLYLTPGMHTVRIGGAFPRIYFNNTGDKSKIRFVNQWGAIQWTSFQSAFSGCDVLGVPATDAPDLSACTNLSSMFQDCAQLNQPMDHWQVGTITNMSYMFNQAQNFDQPLSSWDVSQVTNMASMFSFASHFNQDLSTWQVGQVTSMQNMFGHTNQLDQRFGSWDISNLTNAAYMFLLSGLSTANYDSTLIGWARLDPGETAIPSGIDLGALGLTFCAGVSAHQDLIDTYNWSITDAGLGCGDQPFITTWQTTTPNDTITIPTTGTGYDYIVDWGDGAYSVDQTGDASHTYATPGTHTVAIHGTFPRILLYTSPDRPKLLTVEQWGDIAWTSFLDAFRACNGLEVTATDAPDLSGVLSVKNMFNGCHALGQDPNTNWDWDVSGVTNMNAMFYDAYHFNGDITGWDVGNVTDLGALLRGAHVFDQDIGGWDVSGATVMDGMFRDAFAFDQDLGNWNVSNVTSMSNMFYGTGLSTANYDALLIGWSALTLQPNVVFDGGSSTYCAGATARAVLTGAPNNWTITDAGSDPNCGAVVSAKVFLQGPYDSGSGLMNDGLRANGLVPLSEPYTALGYVQVGGGGESIDPSVLTVTGNDAIVDWVFLELRNKNDNTVAEATRCALVQRDGDVVDVDGTSPVSFPVASDNYYVVVRHRNHLGVMTLNTVALTASPATVDLTDGSTPTYGTNAQNTVSGTLVLWSGNVVDDAFIKYAGANNDRDPILVAIGGTIPTATTAGYLPSDVNMDGTVKYAGANNDRDQILVNVGGTVPTATRQEQLP
ncbi:MAG: BspA family leucine-rich repeat surface protein [Flavobacteriales bacterium]|nr:BspA family leucine-rich repeat surface protein [Flavobacteriales bacterium]MCB9193523.1 BspA family leucine-rich repeat surface protein [Flavobacteriales bacterium]